MPAKTAPALSPIDAFQPGTAVRCTITKLPRAAAKLDTLTRLMQMDPGVKRDLRKAQRRRRQNMNVYIRGNREWTSRERCGHYVTVKTGESWTLPYTLNLAPDLRSVEAYLTLDKA
jgi:hypothetical protein